MAIKRSSRLYKLLILKVKIVDHARNCVREVNAIIDTGA